MSPSYEMGVPQQAQGAMVSTPGTKDTRASLPVAAANKTSNNAVLLAWVVLIALLVMAQVVTLRVQR